MLCRMQHPILTIYSCLSNLLHKLLGWKQNNGTNSTKQVFVKAIFVHVLFRKRYSTMIHTIQWNKTFHADHVKERPKNFFVFLSFLLFSKKLWMNILHYYAKDNFRQKMNGTSMLKHLQPCWYTSNNLFLENVEITFV